MRAADPTLLRCGTDFIGRMKAADPTLLRCGTDFILNMAPRGSVGAQEAVCGIVLQEG
jgi:hypothetical protein